MHVGKSLTEKQNDRVRAAMRALLPRYGNVQARLADALDVKQATLSRLLSGKQGTSIHIVQRVAELAGMDVLALIEPDLATGSRMLAVEDPAYPSRARAESAARLLECTDADIHAVVKAHDTPDDPGDAYWIAEFLRERDRRRRREAAAAQEAAPTSKVKALPRRIAR